jgi:hypothetical protein
VTDAVAAQLTAALADRYGHRARARPRRHGDRVPRARPEARSPGRRDGGGRGNEPRGPAQFADDGDVGPRRHDSLLAQRRRVEGEWPRAARLAG